MLESRQHEKSSARSTHCTAANETGVALRNEMGIPGNDLWNVDFPRLGFQTMLDAGKFVQHWLIQANLLSWIPEEISHLLTDDVAQAVLELNK